MPETCFVIMPFHRSFDQVYQTIELAVGRAGFECVRSDFVRRTGNILDQIEAGIRNARFCISDISRDPKYGDAINPNVVYETGIAMSSGRPVILITRNPELELPFDLRHYRWIGYVPRALKEFRSELAEWIREIKSGTESAIDLLRQMLVPNSLGRVRPPFVIAASPLTFRSAFRREGGWNQSPKTFSDYSGIRGLLQAFGTIFGLQTLPELVNPDDYRKVVLQRSMHLYCIGSSKANRWSGWMMEKFFETWIPKWEFRVDPASEDLLNPKVMLAVEDQYHPSPVTGSRIRWDYGLLIRGPFPGRPRLFMMMGGRGALGTQAACMAATEPKFIESVKKKLGADADLENHRVAFYAVVSMKAKIVQNRDGRTNQWIIRPDTFRVHEADFFRRRHR